MAQKFLDSLKLLSMEDLLKLRGRIDRIIQTKSGNELGRRRNKRAAVKTQATLEIEREKEFFDQTHKITIHNISVNGLFFTTRAPIIERDILSIAFRLPASGEKKIIDCEVMRVKKTQKTTGIENEVGARAVGKDTVYKYRDMLKKRGQ